MLYRHSSGKYAYGLLIFSICVSIDLSRSYAGTMKDLEREITRRLPEADNARKTKELDEARQVQLSMLPKGRNGQTARRMLMTSRSSS